MANHKSSEKRARQTPGRTARNTAVKSKVRTAVRAFRDAVSSGLPANELQAKLAEATRTLRKAASKGVLHRRNADRRVSRLAKGFNKAVATPTAAP